MSEIKANDIVRLRSGGPDMAVNFIENENGTKIAVCSWFVNNKRENSRFPAANLELVSK